MPHLMLSAATRTRPGAPDLESHEDLEALRRQVSAIIDTILAESKPDEAPVREKLRRHVADNPGEPEKALLSHLLTVSAAPRDSTS